MHHYHTTPLLPSHLYTHAVYIHWQALARFFSIPSHLITSDLISSHLIYMHHKTNPSPNLFHTKALTLAYRCFLFSLSSVTPFIPLINPARTTLVFRRLPSSIEVSQRWVKRGAGGKDLCYQQTKLFLSLAHFVPAGSVVAHADTSHLCIVKVHHHLNSLANLESS